MSLESLANVKLSFFHALLCLILMRTLPMQAGILFVRSCLRRAVHAAGGMPSSETGSQASKHLAIDWRRAPNSETQSQATLDTHVQGSEKPCTAVSEPPVGRDRPTGSLPTPEPS